MKKQRAEYEIWTDNTGDMIKLQKTKTGWYGCGNEFDFERKTKKEAKAYLKSQNFQHIGYEN